MKIRTTVTVEVIEGYGTTEDGPVQHAVTDVEVEAVGSNPRFFHEEASKTVTTASARVLAAIALRFGTR